ncbi:Helix-turn-helix domain-containing protein [Amycolatopsis arida]|uniref:Helix-turn-helix domain-containing protein n=1 Tax=Amycolatopsis arida TaxID=587909 RepID=A0A1I5NYN1_9PSEU|nr:helix-turn-helix transcriptional regulator [Amycolatopsis arida]TDX98288.1 helix-turn-helix protein [Amycolatopsis arida]SFP26873.1 Helix-turn-helix domain-containing protein [Amycolatopsis arida]
MQIDGDAYQRALGEELRELRKRRGWTRKELNERLQSDISLQTLATYELGTRQCSVVRLAELCLAMGETPQDLLARVHRRVFAEEPGRLRLDLAAVVADRQPELLPLRRWAQDRLRQAGVLSLAVQLDLAAIDWLAELCGVATSELLPRLRRLSGHADDDGDPPARTGTADT